jgi:hypothetical protein
MWQVRPCLRQVRKAEGDCVGDKLSCSICCGICRKYVVLLLVQIHGPSEIYEPKINSRIKEERYSERYQTSRVYSVIHTIFLYVVLILEKRLRS